jgi:hypothetical protein
MYAPHPRRLLGQSLLLSALTLGTAVLAPGSAFAWWYGQPGFHGWHGLPHGSHTGLARHPAVRVRALPYAATPAPMHVRAEPVRATPIALPRVTAIPVPVVPIAPPRVAVVPLPAAPIAAPPVPHTVAWYGPCCLHLSYAFHREPLLRP